MYCTVWHVGQAFKSFLRSYDLFSTSFTCHLLSSIILCVPVLALACSALLLDHC